MNLDEFIKESSGVIEKKFQQMTGIVLLTSYGEGRIPIYRALQFVYSLPLI